MPFVSRVIGFTAVILLLSFVNNPSAQKLLRGDAFVSVVKTAELWNCDNFSL